MKEAVALQKELFDWLQQKVTEPENALVMLAVTTVQFALGLTSITGEDEFRERMHGLVDAAIDRVARHYIPLKTTPLQ